MRTKAPVIVQEQGNCLIPFCSLWVVKLGKIGAFDMLSSNAVFMRLSGYQALVLCYISFVCLIISLANCCLYWLFWLERIGGGEEGGGFFEQDTLCLWYGVFLKISMALGYNFVHLLLINLCSLEYCPCLGVFQLVSISLLIDQQLRPKRQHHLSDFHFL